MRLKLFKKGKFTNKYKLTMIILGSLAFIFLFISIYQSFATYNLRLSEKIIDTKVGSMYDIRVLAIYIDGAPQPNMTEFPTDKEFSHIECFVDGNLDEDITGIWENDSLKITGLTAKTDCNVYFISVQEITITFNANGATLNTPTGCSNSGADRICSCTMIGTTACTITPPTITRANWTIHGWRGTNQTNSSGTAPSNSVSANATWFAISSRNVTLTNLIQNGSFENNYTGWAQYHWATIPSLSTARARTGTRSIVVDTNGSTEIALTPTYGINVIQGQQYYASVEAFLTRYTSGSAGVFFMAELNSATGSYDINRMTINMNTSIINSWQRRSTIATMNRTMLMNDIRVGHTTGNPNNYHAHLDDVMLINLTAAFGAGSEASATWMDANIAYFDGTRAAFTVWNRTHM